MLTRNMLKKNKNTVTLNKPEAAAAALYSNRERLDLPKGKILFCFFEVFLLRATQKQQMTCKGVILTIVCSPVYFPVNEKLLKVLLIEMQIQSF